MSSQTSHLRNRWAMTKSLKNLSRTTTTTTPPSRRNAAGDSWQLQSAKAKFSEVFRRARNEGPQRITRQGKGGGGMGAEKQYGPLGGRSHRAERLLDFFRELPL